MPTRREAPSVRSLSDYESLFFDMSTFLKPPGHGRQAASAACQASTSSEQRTVSRTRLQLTGSLNKI
jgi:hypothetical protein